MSCEIFITILLQQNGIFHQFPFKKKIIIKYLSILRGFVWKLFIWMVLLGNFWWFRDSWTLPNSSSIIAVLIAITIMILDPQVIKIVVNLSGLNYNIQNERFQWPMLHKTVVKTCMVISAEFYFQSFFSNGVTTDVWNVWLIAVKFYWSNPWKFIFNLLQYNTVDFPTASQFYEEWEKPWTNWSSTLENSTISVVLSINLEILIGCF
jgi:hypothetical protein